MVAVKTILLVEDDQVASTTYQSRLEREGFHVETAPDGLAALKMLSRLTVDLVILDLILPKLDGANVLKRMRTTPNLQNIPVIVLSNAASPELSEDAMLTGPTRRLHKTDCPFPLLMETMQELFAINSAQKTAAEPAAAGGTAPASGNGQPKPNGDTTALYNRSPGRGDFLKAVLQKLPEIREHCCAYIRAPGSPVSIPHLVEMHRHANRIHTDAENLNCTRIAMLTRALEALLSEIRAKPSVITPSILQTIAQAVDCLDLLLKGDEATLAKPMGRARVLVVDDDAICRIASVNSLKRANFDTESISDPLAALEKLQSITVDAILLDINMPGISGFELCEKLRHLPGYKTVPVIFITGYSNFDNRKQSVLSGGQDFITKPIFPLELALKTTLHLLKAQVQHPILRNVKAEPGPAGARKSAPLEVPKLEPAALAIGDRFAKNEPAPTVNRLQLQVESPAKSPPATAAPAAATPEPATARSEGLRMRQEPGEEKPAHPGPGEPQAAGQTDDERSQLRIKLAAEQQAAAKLREDFTALQRKLRENAAALEKVEKAWTELQQQKAGQNGNGAAAQQAQNTLKEKEALCNRLEQEVAGLRTEREQMQARLSAAEKVATSVRNDFEALCKQTHYDAAVLAKTRADLQEQSARFNTANETAEQARRTLQEKEAHCTRLEQATAELKAAHSELQVRLVAEQQTVIQLREQTGTLQQQSQENTTALTQARADLQQATEKLLALTAEADQTRKRLQETEGRCHQLEADLAAAAAGRSELEAKLAGEQQAFAGLRQEFEDLKKQYQESAAALDRARADLRQAPENLRTLTAEADQTRNRLQESEARCHQLEADLAAAAAGRLELEAKLADEQRASAELLQEFETTQKQHQDSAAALDQAKADLRQAPEKLRTLTAEADQTRNRLQESEARCHQLEADLAAAVAGRSELETKLAGEQQASAGSRQEFESLQKQYQDSIAALDQARADFEQASEKLSALTAEADQAQKLLEETEARCRQLETDLAGAEPKLSDLEAKLAGEQQASARLRQEFEDLQARHQEGIAALDRARAELEQQSAERVRLESELGRQQESATASTDQMHASLNEQEAWCGQLTRELAGLRQEHQETRARLAAELDTANQPVVNYSVSGTSY